MIQAEDAVGMGMPGMDPFLDALASLDFKLSVCEWAIHLFLQLAHLRVFQIIQQVFISLDSL